MDVLMPQLGETVAEGKITKWFKSAGDSVKPGDNLFEIETDKVSMEVPSTTTGELAEIRVAAGEVAPVGAVVAVIADGSGAAANTSAPSQAATKAIPASAPASAPGTAPSTPSAQRLAAMAPHASPPRGRQSSARSVLRGANARAQLWPRTAARRRGGDAAGAPAGGRAGHRLGARSRLAAPTDGSWPRTSSRRAAAAPRVASAAVSAGPSAAEVMALYRDVPFEEVPLDGMRRTIATRLMQAKQTIPHFYLTADVDIGALAKLREDANAAAPKARDGEPAFKLSVNDLVIKAWAAALRQVPAANAVWAEDRILRFQQSDIGIAVAIDGGLITPVIRHADNKTLSAISNEVRELAARARAKKLRPDEYQGGASAISNLGMYGVREFSAIINPPHATILAVGAARRQAIEREDGGVGFASIMTVTLSCDHRVVDGALGAELLAAFRAFAEQPVTMLV